MMPDYAQTLPCAHDFSRLPVRFRAETGDFRVTEELGFELTGSGDHVWVLVEKDGLNTMDIVKILSESSGVPRREIGYAGLKDKQAITCQWFSLKRRNALDLDTALDGRMRVLEQTRNSRKLRQGSHRGNRFKITLRDIPMSPTDLEHTSSILVNRGVPNYFGPQRFGNAARNLEHAHALVTGSMDNCSRFQRGIYLSAARAFLFNQVLARRVTEHCWDRMIEGDLMMLAGSSSVFKSESGDEAIPRRLQELDIHPTGPLWGKGSPPAAGQAGAMEMACMEAYPAFREGLAAAGLKQERRALRLVPHDLAMTPAGSDELVVEFILPRGAYATSVIREFAVAGGL